MGFYKTPFVWCGKIDGPVICSNAHNLVEMRKLRLFAANVFDDVVGNYQVEDTIIERQGRALHQAEVVAVLFYTVIDYVYCINDQITVPHRS